MNLERAFRISSILLAASGFTGLILTGELPIGLVGLGAAALALSFMQGAGWNADWLVFRLSPGAWNAILASAFIAFGVDLLWISQDLLPAGIHFLILLMVNKLLTLQQRKDFLHLYAISLLEILAAAALTVELWYGAVFLAYLLASIWMKRSSCGLSFPTTTAPSRKACIFGAQPTTFTTGVPGPTAWPVDGCWDSPRGASSKLSPRKRRPRGNRASAKRFLSKPSIRRSSSACLLWSRSRASSCSSWWTGWVTCICRITPTRDFSTAPIPRRVVCTNRNEQGRPSRIRLTSESSIFNCRRSASQSRTWPGGSCARRRLPTRWPLPSNGTFEKLTDTASTWGRPCL